ncbi:MAG: hypothetical protein ACK5V3_11400 [Bdellovibrionales bacterium]
MADNLLKINLALSLFLTGLIWTIQLVHYPAFRYVETQRFIEFTQFHQKWITPIVALPMILELLSSLALVWLKPSHLIVICFVLVLIIWMTTFFLSVPFHAELNKGFDLETIERLISSNWIRTMAWTLKTGLLIFILNRATQ